MLGSAFVTIALMALYILFLMALGIAIGAAGVGVFVVLKHGLAGVRAWRESRLWVVSEAPERHP